MDKKVTRIIKKNPELGKLRIFTKPIINLNYEIIYSVYSFAFFVIITAR
jgi:hypothetical protein